MSLIVQKFGGTSVADAEKIRAAARRALRAQQQGAQVVMVVSAMGKNTDVLVDLAGQVCDSPPAREMDMLLSTGEQVSVALMAMAIHDLGGQAVSLTGAQMEIRTDSAHGKARIRSIGADRIRAHLETGRIVIAAGFQGIDEDLNITTLGRGGSDTTAVALAAVLGADACEIYTDVDGVFTTDPRIEPAARKMDCVSHDEMLELASLGAGVMHSRSIEFGKKFNVPIHVRNSGVFTDAPGTIIGPLPESPDRPVSGAALTKNEAQLTVAGVPDTPGVSLALLEALATANTTVDMIVQNRARDGRTDISFTVLDSELKAAEMAARLAAERIGAREVRRSEPVSKVSVVGLGMARQAGVAQVMFRALADAGVNIQAITTSEIKVSCLVNRDQGQEALRAVHRAFELGREPANCTTAGESLAAAKEAKAADAGAVIARLQAMEELSIDGCELDETQALVSLRHAPDQPGISAAVFEAIADRGLMVDLIVQGIAEDGRTDIGLTVPRKDLAAAEQIVAEMAKRFQGGVASEKEIGILSVTGVGVRSHTGAATRIFRALSEEGINVELIGTSEVKLSVVVAGEHGARALKAANAAFADVIR
ncbi:aspartate kinase [Botrimarina sp.]|uniref:aspartate kinase n=1 Tax=Botrimarina sp. TaxID=2795802 RepID=UPI0032EC57E0